MPLSTNAAKIDIDISIILNVHRDEKYFRRTMTSLERAAEYARSFGLKIELVIVLDKSNAATETWFMAYEASAFDAMQKFAVNNGCLGLSRNDGIRAASGTYVATFDTDDLVSYNYISAMYDVAIASPHRSVVFPEYTFGFGSTHFLCQYCEPPDVSLLSFVADHPYISRFMTRRLHFEDVKYADLHLSKGYAYEDWHLNAELAGNGFIFRIAPATTIYYRQRRGSLLKTFDQLSVKQIPFARLFEPTVFVQICADDYSRYRRREVIKGDPAAVRMQFLSSRVNVLAAIDANSIDAAINISAIDHITAFTNAESALALGAAYFEIARETRGHRFTDAVLLPYMTTGGGELYILNILHALLKLDPTRSFLFVTGQGGVRHKWLERLPKGSVFLDIFNRYPDLTNSQREVLLLRLIQATAPDATIHLKCSQFAQDFYTRFATVLTDNKNVFYRFSDPIRQFQGFNVVDGYSADFVSENMETLDIVVVDNERMLESDAARMDFLASKEVCLPAYCPLADLPLRRIGRRVSSKRLLWASRLDPEKRPEILVQIAAALQAARPDLLIDVWGASYSGFDAASLAQSPNVRVRGAYSGFCSLDADQYDAFIYTTAFDGMPNVVIEAMAVGLPVIAPNIGGIPEVVEDRLSGVVLDSSLNDGELVDAYVSAVIWLYEEGDRLNAMSANAHARVKGRHGSLAFEANVARIFQSVIRVPREEEQIS